MSDGHPVKRASLQDNDNSSAQSIPHQLTWFNIHLQRVEVDLGLPGGVRALEGARLHQFHFVLLRQANVEDALAEEGESLNYNFKYD